MAVAGASSLALGMLFEGALLFVLFHLSHGLEARYTASASASVSDLVGSVPRTAMSVTVSGSGHVAWDTQREVEVASLSRGDCFVLKPGDTVPLDGVVIEGASSVGAIRLAALRPQRLPRRGCGSCPGARLGLAAVGPALAAAVLLGRSRPASAGQEIVTGESVPVRKGRGDTIFAGSTVHDGTIAVRATHGLSASTPASIARLAASALQDKAPVESLLERVTQRWSQVVLAVAPLTLALLLAAGVPLLGPGGAVYRTLGLLTASAPCALFVVPLAFVCAVSVLARHGILVRGAAVLDKLQGVRCVGLDKTGTLTQGMTCTGVRLLDAGSAAEPSDAVEVAAALSLRSSHPIAQAVLREHTGRSASGTPGAERDGTARQLATVADFTSTGGAGVSGTIAGERVLFGSAAHVVKALPESTKALLDETLLSSAGQLFSVLVQTPLQSRGAEGCSATAPRPRVTLFTFADVAKTGSAAMIGELRRRRLHTRILTGDNAASARAMAASLGVPALEVHADMQPRDKAGWVAERQSQGTAVLMMGDGLNDAPALAQADVGVAIATSADSLAADVASVILLSGSSGSSSGASSSSAGGVDSVSRLVFLLDVAHATHRVVLQNLVLAFGAMLSALLPTVGGLVPLWLTVAVHEGSTVLVAANSCRLLMMRPPPATAAS